MSLKPGLEGYIVPSKLYGILAAGRPFVAAVDPSCEAAAIATEHDCGVVAPPGNPEALVSAISALCDDPHRARRLGENARRASWCFDRRTAVRAYHDLFAGLSRAAVVSMIKRIFDASLAAACLLLSSPLWLLIPIAIKLEDGGPIFFPQERVGLRGRVFMALKFRSMRPNAEALTGPVQATENDPRVTRSRPPVAGDGPWTSCRSS